MKSELVIIGAVAVLIASNAMSAEKSRAIVTADPYTRTITVATKPRRKYSLVAGEEVLAWLSVGLFADQELKPEILVSFDSPNGWKFLSTAHDVRGNSFVVIEVDREVLINTHVVESVAIQTSLNYLEEARARGIDIRLDGKRGSVAVKLPESDVRDFMDQVAETTTIMATGTIPRDSKIAVTGPRTLGVGIVAVDERMAAALQSEPGRGVLIITVTRDSPADAAGLKVGDVIMSLNDRAVNGPEALQDALRAMEADGGKIAYRRGDSEEIATFKFR